MSITAMLRCKIAVTAIEFVELAVDAIEEMPGSGLRRFFGGDWHPLVMLRYSVLVHSFIRSFVALFLDTRVV